MDNKKLILLLIPILYLNCAISSSLDSISNISNSISRSLSSLSTSLESISNSFRSSSESISDSSKKEEKKQMESYKNEIRYLTMFAIKESISSEEYLREVQRIAYKYGLYNWKTLPYTYIGIGEGAKWSSISKKEWLELTNHLNPEMKIYLQQGYKQLDNTL